MRQSTIWLFIAVIIMAAPMPEALGQARAASTRTRISIKDGKWQINGSITGCNSQSSPA